MAFSLTIFPSQKKFLSRSSLQVHNCYQLLLQHADNIPGFNIQYKAQLGLTLLRYEKRRRKKQTNKQQKKPTESITYYKIAWKILLPEQHINDSTTWDVLKYRFLAHVMENKKVYLPVNMTSETLYF